MSGRQDGFQIALLIREINSKVNYSLTEEFKSSGLTVPQVTVVKLLAKGKLKLSEISERMSLSNSTVSGIVDRLEKLEIVTRARSEVDRRVVYIELSAKGQIFVTNYRGMIGDYFESVFKDASPEDIEIITRGLQMLLKRIN